MNRFSGWRVLGGGFINAMLLAGAAVYSFSLFVTPVSKEFNLSREQTYYGIITLYLSTMIWAPLIGRLLERISARTLAVAGGLGFGAGFALLGLAQHPAHILISIFFFLGFGFTAAGPFSLNVLATRWFKTMRGRALGIAAVATSAGGMVVVPAFSAVMERLGWRGATVYFGLAVMAIVIAIALTQIISAPEDVGQHPDGIAAPQIEDETQAAPIPNGFAKRREFWLIGLGAGLLLGSDQALLASIVPYVEGRNIDRQTGAYLLSTIAASAIAGKLIVGWLAERMDRRLLFAMVCSANLLFLFVLIANVGINALFGVAALTGLAIGGVYPVWTTLTAAHFGAASFGRVIGAMNLITIPILLVSLTLAGRTFDETGDYALAFKIFVGQTILAAVIILCLPRKRVS